MSQLEGLTPTTTLPHHGAKRKDARLGNVLMRTVWHLKTPIPYTRADNLSSNETYRVEEITERPGSASFDKISGNCAYLWLNVHLIQESTLSVWSECVSECTKQREAIYIGNLHICHPKLFSESVFLHYFKSQTQLPLLLYHFFVFHS